ncbi:MAG: aldolase/citrate lyase family protein, partial [Betaproteobacteria bacterium]
MEMPVNRLKQNLKAGKVQTGCWISLASHASAEICASAGFDWVLIDTEHAPNELHSVHHQLHAAAAYPSPVLVRAAWNDMVTIKRLLDVGVQSLLLPYVQNEEEAKRAVASVRYPPRGVRGVSTNSRSNRFGRVPDYFKRADDEICLILQVETRAALSQLEKMAAIDGVDGL